MTTLTRTLPVSPRRRDIVGYTRGGGRINLTPSMETSRGGAGAVVTAGDGPTASDDGAGVAGKGAADGLCDGGVSAGITAWDDND